MNELTITIKEDGTIRFLHHDELGSLAQLGTTTTKRASQVHPRAKSLRFAFYALRFVFGENSRVGNWTRRWKCLWMVDLAISGGPAFGPFKDRADAIKAEEAWIGERL